MSRGNAMNASGRLALLAGNTAVALAGAAIMFMLVRTVSVDPPRVGDHEGGRSVDALERMTFVPPGAWSPPELRLGSVDASPITTASLGEAPTWSTETLQEALIPRAVPPPGLVAPHRFPWQSAAPGNRRRPYTLRARLAEISPGATARLATRFEAAKAAWPPAEIALIAIKDEKVLELHTRPAGGAWKLIHRYRVLAASGSAGPKLRQGDRQVPEGIYGISFLNPNSAYHVSLRVSYPNAFDRQMAAKDGRRDLGGDIMIHGKNLSAGCLAIGDEAVEELFLLAAQTGLPNVKLIIAPTDVRRNGVPAVEPGRPEWLPALYAELATAMTPFKAAESSPGLLSFFMK